MKHFLTIAILSTLIFGCTSGHKYQKKLIKEYEQVVDGIKTDLNMKILKIERFGTEPINNLNYRQSEFKSFSKIIEDNDLEEAQFPVFEATYRIFNPLLQVNQEITKYYAFDPQMKIIVTSWNQ